MSNKSPTQSEPTPTELRVARLVSHCWDLLSDADREAALAAARYFGCQLADETHGTDEEAYGDPKDYRRVCVVFASETCKVINDVERELWRSQDDDPRVVSFRRGFEDRARELRAS
jgi:hypothetical protein